MSILLEEKSVKCDKLKASEMYKSDIKGYFSGKILKIVS